MKATTKAKKALAAPKICGVSVLNRLISASPLAQREVDCLEELLRLKRDTLTAIVVSAINERIARDGSPDVKARAHAFAEENGG